MLQSLLGIFVFGAASLAFVTSLVTEACPESCRCLGNTLKCSPDTGGGVELQRVPTDLLRYNLFHIHEVDLSHNGLQQVEPGDFFGLPRATKLDLRYNKLRALLRNGFKGLDDLHTLDLSHNVIRYIDRFAFEGLQSIRRIDLSHNSIAFVEDDAFYSNHGLAVMFTLDISYNQMHDLDEGTFMGLESMQELYLNHNVIREMNTAVFTPLRNLKRLYVGGNDIACTCDWLGLLDSLQSRDIEIMDMSDAFGTCGNDVINCKSQSAQTYPLSKPLNTFTAASDPPVRHAGGHERVAANLTAEDLRPPATDSHGNILADDGNSFPLLSAEGERVLSGYDAAMRGRIAAVEDGGRRRLYSVLFQKRMRDFLKGVGRGGKDRTSRLRPSGGQGAENNDHETGSIDNGDDEDDVTAFPSAIASKNEAIDVMRATLMKAVLKDLLPASSGSPNSTEFVRTLFAKAKSPETAWLLHQMFGNSPPPNPGRTEAKAEPNAPMTTPRSRTVQGDGTLHVGGKMLESALTRPEIEIPIFTVIGILVFVCIIAGAIAMFSGLCRAYTEDDSLCCGVQCCQYKNCLSPVTEKLSMRKQQIERQRHKTSLAKSGFLKMHCRAKQLVADDQGVVSVTPLVLTEEFPQSQHDQRQTTSGLLGYLKKRLSSSDEEANTKQPPSTSPRDEITLFEITTLKRGTSESQAQTNGTPPVNSRSRSPGSSTDEMRVDDEIKKSTGDQNASTPKATDQTKDLADGEAIAGDDAADPDVKRTSSDLRWYARECLSNQRLMVQGRTLSMTSSEGVTVADGTKADSKRGGVGELDDGVW